MSSSYYEENKETAKQSAKDYYSRNKKKVKTKMIEYNEEHRERLNELALKWYHDNKHDPVKRERRLQYARMYYQAK